MRITDVSAVLLTGPCSDDPHIYTRHPFVPGSSEFNSAPGKILTG